jgi:Protein of unknown function (DUF2892)
MQFVEWMSKPAGRILRIVAGIILIGVGLYFQDVWGYVVAVVGVVPVLAGVFPFCLIAPILGAPFRPRSLA